MCFFRTLLALTIAFTLKESRAHTHTHTLTHILNAAELTVYSEAEAVGPHWWRRLLLQGQLGLTTELSSVLILPQADLDGGGHVHRGPDHLGVTVHLVLVLAAGHSEADWTQRDREQTSYRLCTHIQPWFQQTGSSK